jgi:23S rRNA (cytosine1962-C5)-methyltransferase
LKAERARRRGGWGVDVCLKEGKDRPVRHGHPWVFSGAIADLDPATEAGRIVRVLSASGEPLGWGYINPRCTIAVRLLTSGDQPIDEGLISRRVERARALRQRLVGAESNAYRLVNGEGDGLPGFLVDRYGDVLVVQVLTAGAEHLKSWLVDSLVAQLAPRCVLERSAGAVRRQEGLPDLAGVLRGATAEDLVVRENGLDFEVSPLGGQKTGHFCDQRVNRRLLRRIASGRRVLDCFAYTGGFAVHAGAGAAQRVIAVESSARFLEGAERNWRRNRLPSEAVQFVRADVHQYLRDAQETFDVLILDPPALVRQRKDTARGARAYKDVNLRAFRRAAPDALVLTFTCSQHVDSELFRKIVLGAAADAGRRAQILGHLGPGPDHPVALGHPEGEYLHGLFLRLD